MPFQLKTVSVMIAPPKMAPRPRATTVVALGLGAIFGGAIITEQVFNWNGMGSYLTQQGLGQSDLNVVLAWLIVSSFFIVLFNLIADLLYAVLDPRIRLS